MENSNRMKTGCRPVPAARFSDLCRSLTGTASRIRSTTPLNYLENEVTHRIFIENEVNKKACSPH
jgi:hypothetical protein